MLTRVSLSSRTPQIILISSLSTLSICNCKWWISPRRPPRQLVCSSPHSFSRASTQSTRMRASIHRSCSRVILPRKHRDRLIIKRPRQEVSPRSKDKDPILVLCTRKASKIIETRFKLRRSGWAALIYPPWGMQEAYKVASNHPQLSRCNQISREGPIIAQYVT